MQTIKVFLASPSDTGAERERVTQTIDDFNSRQDNHSIKFELVRWEAAPGSAGRPQSKLSELMHDCSFLICIFKNLWGTPPGDDRYTSGTEEEFFTALQLMQTRDKPMADIWLCFATGESDGAKPVKEVTDFKSRLIESRTLLFEQARNIEHLHHKLNARLEAWTKWTTDPTLNKIDLKTSTGADVLSSIYHIESARLYERLGNRSEADTSYRKAIKLGDARAHVEYIEFLGRNGDFKKALEEIPRADANAQCPTNSTLSPLELFRIKLVQASIERRQGNLLEAEATLLIANGLVNSTNLPKTQQSRYSDEFGQVELAKGRIEDRQQHKRELFAKAVEYFTKSVLLREGSDREGLVRALSLRARAYTELEEYEKAESDINRALSSLGSIANSLMANVFLAAAQYHLARYKSGAPNDTLSKNQEILYEARKKAELSLQINLNASLKRGMAMAHKVLAEIYKELGDARQQSEHAQKAISINAEIDATPPAELSILGNPNES